MEEFVETLKKAAQALEEAEVPYLLGGSVAAWARGGPESASDLDLMVRPDDADRALQVLGEAGFRTERPPEQWLYKAYDGDVLLDVIFGPTGLDITDEVFERAEEVNVGGMCVPAITVEDVMTTKLLALNERDLDLEPSLSIARALREQIDWAEVRSRTSESPYARAFFTLAEGLGVVRADHGESDPGRPRIRLA